MINIIIFDWSGVISDDRLPVYESNMRLLEKYGKSRVSLSQWLPRTKFSVVEFLESFGIYGNPQEILEEYRNTLNSVRKEGIHPQVYPNAKRSLEKLTAKRIRLAVVSSHPEKSLKEEAKEYRIFDLFDRFLGSSRDKTLGILGILKGWNVSYKNASYIGDTIYDIQAAKKANVFSIGITTGYHMKNRLLKEKPDLIVDSLKELLLHFTDKQEATHGR